eukprot:377179_1
MISGENKDEHSPDLSIGNSLNESIVSRLTINNSISDINTTYKSVVISNNKHKTNEYDLRNNTVTSVESKNAAIGLTLMIISGLFYSLLAVFVQCLSDLNFKSEEIVIYRAVQQIFICVTTSLFTRNSKSANSKKFGLYGVNDRKLFFAVVGRGIFGAFGVYGYFESIHLIPIGDTLSLKGLCPIFTSFVAFLIFKDKITLTHGIALLLGISATILITQPPFIFGSNSGHSFQDNTFGYMFAVESAIAQTITYICIKYAKTVSPTVLVLSQGICSCILALILLYTFKNAEWNPITTWIEIVYILGLGSVGYIAQLTLTKGGQLLISGFASLLRTTDIVWSFIWQIIFWRLIPNVLTISGAVMMLCGISLISFEKIRAGKQKKIVPMKQTKLLN